VPRAYAQRQRAGVEHPDEVHTRCMVLVDLFFHLAPRPVVTEHFDDELGACSRNPETCVSFGMR